MCANCHNPRRAGKLSWLMARVLLAVLPGVVAAVILARGRSEHDDLPNPPAESEYLAEEVVMQPQYAAGGQAAPAKTETDNGTETLTALLPRLQDESSYHVSTAAQEWPADSMYEKINGEDIVYLDAGCIGLAAVSFSDETGMKTLDVFLFEMTSDDAAREVFDQQMPSPNGVDGQDRFERLDLGDRAYMWYGSCYVQAGKYYLKIIVSSESQAAKERAVKLARQFVKSLPDERAHGMTREGW